MSYDQNILPCIVAATQQCNCNKHGSRTTAKVTIIYLFIHYRLFTGMYLEQTMSLGYRILQLFCCYSTWCMSSYLPWQIFGTLH